jgi:hypothetical protein
MGISLHKKTPRTWRLIGFQSCPNIMWMPILGLTERSAAQTVPVTRPGLPRHTGPRFYSAKRSGTLPNVLSTVSVWIAGANERHGSGVTEQLPIPFGSLYGRC